MQKENKDKDNSKHETQKKFKQRENSNNSNKTNKEQDHVMMTLVMTSFQPWPGTAVEIKIKMHGITTGCSGMIHKGCRGQQQPMLLASSTQILCKCFCCSTSLQSESCLHHGQDMLTGTALPQHLHILGQTTHRFPVFLPWLETDDMVIF